MKVAIMDLESMMYAKLYSKSDEVKEFEHVKEAMDKSIQNLFFYTNCTHYIGFLTTKSFRYGLYSEYKGKRKDKPEFYAELKQYLIDKYIFQLLDNYEADDLCAACAKSFRENNIDYVVCNIDKDLDQIVGTHFNYQKNSLVYINEFEAMYNLATQMFVSQPSDNIHPCKGIGEKAAIEILSTCKTKLDFIKQVLNVYKNGYKRFKGYEDYKDKIRLYYKLVYLEENIPFDYLNSINKI